MRVPRLIPTRRCEWQGHSRYRTALLAAVVLAACACVLAPAGSAADSSASPCWQRVIADWTRDGRVDHTYPLACYREAVERLPEDLRTYSSAPDDIDRALMERRSAQSRTERTEGPVTERSADLAASAPQPGAGGGHDPLIVIVPGVGGLLVAAGLSVWLLRGRLQGSRLR